MKQRILWKYFGFLRGIPIQVGVLFIEYFEEFLKVKRLIFFQRYFAKILIRIASIVIFRIPMGLLVCIKIILSFDSEDSYVESFCFNNNQIKIKRKTDNRTDFNQNSKNILEP